MKGYENRHQYYLTIAKELCKMNPVHVLDIGCNAGQLVEAFHNIGIQASGCDISHENISRAPSKLRNYLIQADIQNDRLPFKAGEFDFVTMIDVIEHFKEFNRAFMEIKRVLSVDGKMYISTPSPLGCFLLRSNDPTHFNVHSKSYWIKFIEKHGFEYVGDFPRESRMKALNFLGNSNLKMTILNFFMIFLDVRANLIFKKVE